MSTSTKYIRSFVLAFIVAALAFFQPSVSYAAFIQSGGNQDFALSLEPADYVLSYPLAQHDELKLEGELAAGESKSYDVNWKLRLPGAAKDADGNSYDLEIRIDKITISCGENDVSGTLASLKNLTLSAGSGVALSFEAHLALMSGTSPVDGSIVLSISGIDSTDATGPLADTVKIVSGKLSDIYSPQNASLVASENDTQIRAREGSIEGIIAFVANAHECVLKLSTNDSLNLLPRALQLAEPEPEPEPEPELEPEPADENEAATLMAAEEEPATDEQEEPAEDEKTPAEDGDSAAPDEHGEDTQDDSDNDKIEELDGGQDGQSDSNEPADDSAISDTSKTEEPKQDSKQDSKKENESKPAESKPAESKQETPATNGAEENIPEPVFFTVTFKDPDNRILSVETVEYGHAAQAPRIPRRVDEHFIYWDHSFSYVTSDLVVHAVYAPGGLPGTGDTSTASAALALLLAGLCCFMSSKLHSLRAALRS